MGFSPIPPRLSTAEVLRTADAMSEHADAALMVLDVPWAALLGDTSAALLVRRDQLQLARLLTQRGVPLVATLEPANGLDRGAEAAALVARGRSITEPAVQRVYREYVAAFDSIVRPDYLVLAVETNLIRAASKPSVYAALVTMSNGAPYLAGFKSPEEIPLDYYSRLTADAPLPMIVTEGGWTSGSVTGVTSSPELQARYIRRQMQLADAAKLVGVFQITFTDLDVATYNLPPGSILPLFAQLGLVDANYRPKPALAVWDSVKAR